MHVLLPTSISFGIEVKVGEETVGLNSGTGNKEVGMDIESRMVVGKRLKGYSVSSEDSSAELAVPVSPHMRTVEIGKMKDATTSIVFAEGRTRCRPAAMKLKRSNPFGCLGFKSFHLRRYVQACAS